MSDHLAWLRTKRVVSLFTLAGVLGVSAGVRADEPAAPPAATGGAAAPAAPAASEPAAPTPITYGMEGVEAVGLKPTFDDLRLNFYGWVEGSYTYSHEAPSDRTNNLRVFDVRSNEPMLNQVSENLERTLKDGKDFDIGGKIELMEGSDARFIHSSGLVSNIAGEHDDLPHGRDFSFDPTVFYVDFRIPVGEGLTVKVGKYVTTLGEEVIDAPGNALFSHSYLFGFAIPFTHTGVEFDYPINDKLSVYFGIVVGWDDFFDRNSSPGYMTGGTWKATDKLTLLVNAITGPEEKDDTHDWRTVLDTTVTYQITDALSIAINGDYGNESGVEGPGAAGNTWEGIAGYVNYVLVPSVLNVNARYEYFRDASATRLGFTGDVTELTVGLDIHPIKDWQNLRVRPEVRWDHSYGKDNAFDSSNLGGGSDDQFTIGADVIVTF